MTLKLGDTCYTNLIYTIYFALFHDIKSKKIEKSQNFVTLFDNLTHEVDFIQCHFGHYSVLAINLYYVRLDYKKNLRK